MTAYIQTVTGPIPADELGITSAHEHCLIDCTPWAEEPTTEAERELAEARVSLDNVGLLSRRFFLNRDNFEVFDADVAADELERFRAAGGDAIVDLTSIGIGRDVAQLAALAHRTGLRIVAGCGYYIDKAHPASVAGATVEQICDEIVRDLLEGVDDHGVRAGVIGEIGTSEEITPSEEKVLRAAGRAQRETAAGVNVHTYLWAQRGLEALDILEAAGAALDKVAISHVDHGTIDLDYQRALIARGAYVEYDGFGKEYYLDAEHWFPRDTERVAAIARLVAEGHASRILLGCDVCAKMNLVRWGGTGYEHLLRHVVPMLLASGVAQGDVDSMLIHNPRRFLALGGDGPAVPSEDRRTP